MDAVVTASSISGQGPQTLSERKFKATAARAEFLTWESRTFYHVPTFMLDECTGQVHEFDPARDRARDTGTVVTVARKDGSQRQFHLPAGRIVGDIGDRGPDLSAIERLMSRALY